MTVLTRPDRRTRYALRSAQWSTLALGIGLAVWGFAPLVVERLTSHCPPLFETLLVNSVTLLLGATFIGLCVLIGRGVNWALWAAVGLSTMLVASILAVSIIGEPGPLPLFPLVLASCASLTSWLAIVSRNSSARRARSPYTA